MTIHATVNIHRIQWEKLFGKQHLTLMSGSKGTVMSSMYCS